MRRTWGSVLVVCMVVMLSLVLVQDGYAGSHKSKDAKHWSLKDKLFHKICFLMENEDEVGLTEDQVDKIKALKVKAKKAYILKKAEIKATAVEIKGLLWSKKIDVAAINALIDKKYEMKKEKAKALVASYAELKGMLTEEQMDKMKVVWKANKKKQKNYCCCRCRPKSKK